MEVQDEAARVIGWRLDQLIGLGFDVQRAEELARKPGHELDVHYIRHLIRDLAYTAEQAWALVA